MRPRNENKNMYTGEGMDEMEFTEAESTSFFWGPSFLRRNDERNDFTEKRKVLFSLLYLAQAQVSRLFRCPS